MTASQVAEREKLRKVTEIKIKMGDLQQIETDILEFALSQIKHGKLKEAKFIIESVPAKLKCKACGHTWTFDGKKLDKESREAVHFVPEIAHTFIKCPKCGSPDFEILEGRGVWLESVGGEKQS